MYHSFLQYTLCEICSHKTLFTLLGEVHKECHRQDVSSSSSTMKLRDAQRHHASSPHLAVRLSVWYTHLVEVMRDTLYICHRFSVPALNSELSRIKAAQIASQGTVEQHCLRQWFSSFLMLQPLNTVAHVVKMPSHKIVFIATS